MQRPSQAWTDEPHKSVGREPRTFDLVGKVWHSTHGMPSQSVLSYPIETEKRRHIFVQFRRLDFRPGQFCHGNGGVS